MASAKAGWLFPTLSGVDYLAHLKLVDAQLAYAGLANLQAANGEGTDGEGAQREGADRKCGDMARAERRGAGRGGTGGGHFPRDRGFDDDVAFRLHAALPWRVSMLTALPASISAALASTSFTTCAIMSASAT